MTGSKGMKWGSRNCNCGPFDNRSIKSKLKEELENNDIVNLEL